MAKVTITKVTKRYGETTVIPSLDLDIHSGEFMVLVGPSGCGKSTLLRLVAGLEEASAGTISIEGRVVNALPPKARGVAMVFQSYALYPHMTVQENLAFGLKLSKLPQPEIKRRVREAAAALAIEEHLHKKPSQLSGGQKQRVAMGRAMVREPKVFLFDEPLSNLDAQLRVKMRSEISLLHRRLKSTVIYVTHDQVEAMTLADRIAVLNHGRLEQLGTPLTLYREPATQFVASFIGTPSMNFLPVGLLPAATAPAGSTIAGVRPEMARLSATSVPNTICLGPGQVRLIEPLGSLAYVHVEMGRELIVAEAPIDAAPTLEQSTWVCLDPKALYFFDAQGRRVGISA